MSGLHAVRMGRQLPGLAPMQADPLAELAALRAQALSEGQALGLAQGRDQGLREGRQQGLAQGLAEGRAQAQRDAAQQAARAEAAQAAALREARELWAQAAERLQANVAALSAGCAQELQLLCAELLARLLGEALAQPQAIQARLRSLLQTVPVTEPVTVRVHPCWLTSEGGLPASDTSGVADDRFAAVTRVRFVPDPALGLADIQLDLTTGSLDARLDRVWEQVRAALRPPVTAFPQERA